MATKKMMNKEETMIGIEIPAIETKVINVKVVGTPPSSCTSGRRRLCR